MRQITTYERKDFKMQIIENLKVKEKLYIEKLENGLTVMIIPKENTELCKAVESEFIPMLKDKSKFHIIDPQELLAPLEGNEKYSKLLEYLRKRYW